MRQLFLLIGAAAVFAQPGWAASMCSAGSLASYIALGPGGCTIGTDTVGMFQSLSGQNGVAVIDPGTVAITPSGSSTAPVLTFDLRLSTVLTFESIFTYRISGNSFTSSSISSSGSTTTGDGAVTLVQNLCGGGTFGPDGVSGCTGTDLGPLVVVSPDSDQTPITGYPYLSVTNDFVVDGGTDGSASAGKFVNSFTVPEPGTIVITGLGSALLLTFKLRSRRTRDTN